MRWFAMAGILACAAGCARSTADLKPVEPFHLERYLGTWYEIGRYPHRFERGLSHVTAHYALRDDGRVDVFNRGYHAEKGKWKQVRGTARFAGDPHQGLLRVTFFWPFSGTYKVVCLDEDYRYAIVTSGNYNYLWLLARDPAVPPYVMAFWLYRAEKFGFDVSRLEYPEQLEPPEAGEKRGRKPGHGQK